MRIDGNDKEEKELPASRVKYRKLLEQIPAITYIATLSKDSNRIYIIPQIENLLGFSQSEFNDANLWQKQLHPDDRDLVLAEFARCHACKEKFITEYRMLSRDGNVVWFHDEAILIEDDDGGPLYHGVMFNITEQKKVMELLRDSEERYRLLVELFPDMIAIHDDKIIYVNKAAISLMGAKSSDDLIGKPVIDFVHPQYKELAIKRMHEIYVGKKVSFVEQKFIRPDGKIIDVDVAGTLLTIQGKQFVQLIARDITERKRIEQEITRLEHFNLIGKMAAGIAHEIRNPMTSIRGFLQLLGEKQECAKFKEYYDLMIEELDRANFIITEYLSLAKNKVSNKNKQNLNSIVIAIFPLIQAEAMQSDKYVKLELSNIPDLLLDEKEIRQLILNIARNGLEAMEKERVLTIKTFTENDEVILSVQDQGNGIDPDLLNMMGTPFLTTKDTGTGLGLAICYSIASRHMANIKIETSSAGTTFLIVFEKTLSEL